MTLITRVQRVPQPSFNDGSLALWSAFGGATISAVFSGGSWRARVTFPASAAVDAAGIQISLTGLTVGQASRVWASVPSASGSTTVKIRVVGIADVSGATFATNEPLFKTGAFNYTADQTTATLRISNAVTSTAGHWVEVDYALFDEGTTTSYPYFDGTYPGATWDGAPNASVSRWVGYDTDISARPLAVVEIDALEVRTTDFVLDRDSLDDPNVAMIDSPRWRAIPDARSVSIRRGRQTDDSDIDAGQCTITLDDYDGVFDPDNPASPLMTSRGSPVLTTGTAVRVSALVQYLGTIIVLPQFTGGMDDVTIDRTYEPTVVITASDALANLNTANVPPEEPPTGDGAVTLYRALWALGFAGLTVWDASFGSALTRQMIATSGGGNVGSHLREVAACEGGKLFVRNDGQLHIGTHADDFAYTPAATFTDNLVAAEDIEYEDIQTSTSVGRIINRTVITRGDPESGGKESVSAQDDDSVDRNQRVWSETVEIPLYNDADAELMARWRATRRSKGATRVDSVKVDILSQPAVARILLALDMSEVVRIRRQSWNRTLDGTYSTEGIDMDIVAGGKWSMALYTSPLDITELYDDMPRPFFLDTSSLDGPDVMPAF